MKRAAALAVAASCTVTLATSATALGAETGKVPFVACTAAVADPALQQACDEASAGYRAAGITVNRDEVPRAVCFGSVTNDTDGGWLGIAPRRVWTRAAVGCDGALLILCSASQTALTAPPHVVGVGGPVDIDGRDMCIAQTPKVIGPSLQPLVLYWGACIDSNGTVWVSQMKTATYP